MIRQQDGGVAASIEDPIPQFAHCYLRRSALRAALDAEPAPAPGLPVRPTLRHFVAAASAVSSDNVLVPGTVAHDPSKNGHSKPGGVKAAAGAAARHGSGSAFIDALDAELGRVRRFVTARSEELWGRLLAIVQALPALPGPDGSVTPEAQQQAVAILAGCDVLGADSALLERFILRNEDVATELALAKDARRAASPASSAASGSCASSGSSASSGGGGGGAAAWQQAAQDAALRHIYAACVRECLTGHAERDAILVGLSDVYEHLRQIVPDPEASCTTCSNAGSVVDGGSPPPGGSPGSAARLPPPQSPQGVCAIEPVTALPDGGAAASAADGAWVPPDTFERKSTKFWAHESVIPALQTEVIRHLPILVFGRRRSDRLTAGDAAARALQPLAQQHVTAGSCLSSVYYDNPATFSTYEERLRREHGAQLVRVRWYGRQAAGEPGHRLWVERKTHRERWTGQSSIKERADIEPQHLAAFAAGERVPELDGTSRRAELLRDTQTFLTATSQEPVLRTTCTRTAFQNSDSSALRVSIDTGLTFTKARRRNLALQVFAVAMPPTSLLVLEIQEAGAALRAGEWCRPETAALGRGDAERFPYAVVEIKVEGAGQPLWVGNLVASGMLLEVPMFSKYSHAAALLFPRQVAPVGVPYWFLPDEGGSMTPASYEEMSDTSDIYLKDAAPWAFPRNFQAPTKTSRSGRLLAFLRGGASGSSPRAAGGSGGGSRRLPRGSGHGGGGGRPGGSGGSATLGGANGSGGGSAGGNGGGGGVAFSGFSTLSGAPQGSPFGPAAQSPAMRAAPPSAAPTGWQSAPPHQAQHGHQRSASAGVAETGSTAVTGGRFMGPRADGSHPPAGSQAATAATGRSGSFTGGGLRRPFGRVVTPAGDAGFSDAGGGSGGGSGRSLRQLSCRTSADAAPPDGASHSLPLQRASTGSAATRPAAGGADPDGGGGGSSGNGVGGGAWAGVGPAAALADLPPWPVRCASARAASPLPSAGPGPGPGPNDSGPSAAAPPAGPYAGQRANGGPGCIEAVPPPASSPGALLLSGAPRSEDGSPVSPSGHTVVEMRALEARQMAPPGTAATTAAVAALAAEYGDVEEGRPGAGGAVAAPVKSRRGFSRWASGKLRRGKRGGGGGGGGGGDGSGGGGSLRSVRVAKERSQALVRTRVEPKTFFANERTFLQWLQISVLIMFMALSLLGGSTLSGSSGSTGGVVTNIAPKIAGMVIAPVAFIFILYALFMYKKRTIQILRRQNVRYDDQRGPVLLVFLLACALIAATVFTAKSAFGG